MIKFLAGTALLVACVCLLAWIIVVSFHGDDECHQRGGHMQPTSWIWTGKTLVPIDTCVGARP